MTPPIFVTGMPRACSTLLMNLLAQNPKFYCTPTSFTPCIIEGIRNQFSQNEVVQAQPREKLEPMMVNACVGALEGWYSKKSSSIIFDKSRGWLENYHLLRKMYGESLKMIVLVRDIPSVLASIETRHRANPEYSLGDINSGMSIIGRCEYWMQNNPLGTSLKALYDSCLEVRDVLYVRAEDFTTNPQDTLDTIYKYIGEPSFAHVCNEVVQYTVERDELHMPIGSHTIHPSITPIRVDTTIIPKGFRQEIMEGNSWFYDNFYKGMSF